MILFVAKFYLKMLFLNSQNLVHLCHLLFPCRIYTMEVCFLISIIHTHPSAFTHTVFFFGPCAVQFCYKLSLHALGWEGPQLSQTIFRELIASHRPNHETDIHLLLSKPFQCVSLCSRTCLRSLGVDSYCFETIILKLLFHGPPDSSASFSWYLLPSS